VCIEGGLFIRGFDYSSEMEEKSVQLMYGMIPASRSICDWVVTIFMTGSVSRLSCWESIEVLAKTTRDWIHPSNIIYGHHFTSPYGAKCRPMGLLGSSSSRWNPHKAWFMPPVPYVITTSQSDGAVPSQWASRYSPGTISSH